MKNLKIIYSNRKTMSVEILNDLTVLVRAPIKKSRADIGKFLEDSKAWIEKYTKIMKERNKNPLTFQPYANEELCKFKEKAMSVIPQKVEYYSKIIGVDYEKITYGAQVSKWGSCSFRGELTFNYLLAQCPDAVIDYVIIHELCHRIFLNHSKEFWKTVERFCPDYKIRLKWLKTDGDVFIKRLRATV